MRIGQCLKRVDWGDPHIASDRIRGEWIMKFCPEMEEWCPSQTYDTIVFHNATPWIAKTSGLKILDICDPIWSYDPEDFRRVVEPVAGFVTATEELSRQVLRIVDKPVRTIGDGHYFPFYETRVPNPHERRATEVVWFGYADNAVSLTPFLETIGKYGLRLKVIAERNPFPGSGIANFVPWRLETYIAEISRADFALLPFTKPHKSNNKDISALLAGVPVAKTTEDVERLTDPLERSMDMKSAAEVVARHDVCDRAQEYLEWIRELYAERRT